MAIKNTSSTSRNNINVNRSKQRTFMTKSDGLFHYSAKPSHYNKESQYYDLAHEEKSEKKNIVIENILREHKVKTVLDLTCGTGLQTLWLAKRGYEVVGSDISAKMLKIAKSKANKEQLDVKLIHGDMRSTNAGNFDAVITIFNAVGHLTKLDFEKSMNNINSNLKEGGIYIFDILNLTYLMAGNNITKLTFDNQHITGDTKVREIQYSTVDKDGVLSSYTTLYEKQGSSKQKMCKMAQTLQIYTTEQLNEMLGRSGFKVIDVREVDGSKFIENESDNMLMTAKKLRP